MGPKVLKGGPTKTMKYIITIKNKNKNGLWGGSGSLGSPPESIPILNPILSNYYYFLKILLYI